MIGTTGKVKLCLTGHCIVHVKIALSEKIALLLHPHVDVPCSLAVT